MKIKTAAVMMMVVLIAGIQVGCQDAQCQAKSCQKSCPMSGKKWEAYDSNRPQPVVVAPAQQVGQPPADAIVLFDGTGLAAWQSGSGDKPAPWKVENGYMEAAPKAGDIRTRQEFGDCQLHVEWATPEVVAGEGQGRGNSGVYLMDRYEVQVLDSFNNKTYPDGQAGAIYGQSPPLVNACRPPGQWQCYDIVFHRPRFNKSGKVVCPARVSVWQNGIIIQDDFVITGPTGAKVPAYQLHNDKLPLRLQDHGNPIRYRNIWIRPLE